MRTPTILRRASKAIDDAVIDEFKSQGHSLTGATEKSIQGKVLGDRVEGEMADHGFILNAGTKASRIPYKRGSGGGTSKYIEGLKTFFRLRGLSEQEAERAAFATANVQKKEGMSTGGSKQYSKTGERQKFVEIASGKVEKEVDSILFSGMDEIFNTEFEKQKSERI
ncbi:MULTISPECIES: hypothetical protein [Chryseobacterium]|uniref:Phage protein, HK97 gp10 family n=1 Tax=Chryseobacterium gambrini TaxID=373672 RepID=A0A1N7LEE9_9FLAO|nr:MULTISPECIES: hypothetical protein [Chryseobacterium]SIS72212.1 hypothetical protein SAMN05421785_102181 [Chryseobacterium gambrini]